MEEKPVLTSLGIVDAIIQDLCDIPENTGEDCEAANPGKAICTNLDDLEIILRRHILGEE